MEEFKSLMDKLRPERASMIDTGLYSDIIQGYLLLTLEGLYYPEEKIKEAIDYSATVLDTTKAIEAIQRREERLDQWQRERHL